MSAEQIPANTLSSISSLQLSVYVSELENNRGLTFSRLLGGIATKEYTFKGSLKMLRCLFRTITTQFYVALFSKRLSKKCDAVMNVCVEKNYKCVVLKNIQNIFYLVVR